jgi:stage III sporulation protein AD
VLFVRSAHAQTGFLLSLCGAVWLLTVCVSTLSPITEYLSSLSESAGFGEYMPYIFKSLSVGFIGHFSSEICRDAGEHAIASSLQSASKLAVVALCLPLVGKIADIAVSYI